MSDDDPANTDVDTPTNLPKEYRLVKYQYEEIEAERTIYTSDEECTSIVFNNNT